MHLRHALIALLLLPLLSPAFTATTSDDCGRVDAAERSACFQETSAGRRYEARPTTLPIMGRASAGHGRSDSSDIATPPGDTLTVLSITPKGDTARTITIRSMDPRKAVIVKGIGLLAYTAAVAAMIFAAVGTYAWIDAIGH